ncbi:MAG: N-6 DNA methylase [Bacillota bacterium]
MPAINYNERSWAIDLISEINRWAQERSVIIRRAGGERTLRTPGKNYFPDVLLYGDDTSGLILQGWELKMPDTPISDPELLRNAKDKAIALGLNSFLVWNVSLAVLYIIDEKGVDRVLHRWNDLAHITGRDQVEALRQQWVDTLYKILDDLVDFFRSGTISSTSIIDSIAGEGIADIILSNAGSTGQRLKEAARTNSDFDDEVTIWWLGAKQEYKEYSEPFTPLARILILSWINKFIFAHLLKSFHEAAKEVDDMTGNITIPEAVDKIKNISSKCDFWNVFRTQLGEKYIPDIVWKNLIQFNDFLADLRLQAVDQSLIQHILENTVNRIKRRVAGQFSTPLELAALLVSLALKDKEESVIDPCCGTGTIARAAYNIKVCHGITPKQALSKTWAGDKFDFQVQMATLAMTIPENMGEIIRVFCEDASRLKSGQTVKLHHPEDGREVHEPLPEFGCIVSNLPFVQQEDLKHLNPGLANAINSKIKDITGEKVSLEGRSDLYAYLPFALWSILKNNGRMGIIISNSWLSSDWGITFRRLLDRFFKTEYIVTSGKGRWFENADVVTNILILSKRSKEDIIKDQSMDEAVSFVTLNRTIKDIAHSSNDIDYDKIRELTALIRTNSGQGRGLFTKSTYTKSEINELSGLGLGWNALFADCKWLLSVSDKLIKAGSLFEINRGERRGWDKMFYPSEGHGIEPGHIKPVLLSSKDIEGLITEARSEAFCCTASKDELRRLGDSGALKWIEKFESGVNEKGEPLTKVLSRPGVSWYTMLPSTLADMVMSINPGERLFVARLKERSFVNQRLTRFTARNSKVNIDLCHALINSILGLFYIESLGFGRGLGALDLSSTKLKNGLYMLNPDMLSDAQKNNILSRFELLRNRQVLDLPDELDKPDRKAFDDAILESYGMREYKEQIESALRKLYQIRKSVGK